MIHMAFEHPGYTKEEAEIHPDFDCESFTHGFKTQPIEDVLITKERDSIWVVDIIYLNHTFSRHEFKTRKEARILKKEAKRWQASIQTIINERINRNR